MARGFDSKAVSDQQDERERAREARERRPEDLVSPARRSLELARVDLQRRLQAAPERQRDTLLRALADVEERLARC
jgi:hypothetical protein